jgi:hypothetical protein
VLARGIDDDVAHRLGGIGEEVAPVVELQVARVHQPHEALVHQRRRVHALGTALLAQPRARNALELRVERRIDAVERPPVAAGRQAQQLRDRRFGFGGRRQVGHAASLRCGRRGRPREDHIFADALSGWVAAIRMHGLEG